MPARAPFVAAVALLAGFFGAAEANLIMPKNFPMNPGAAVCIRMIGGTAAHYDAHPALTPKELRNGTVAYIGGLDAADARAFCAAEAELPSGRRAPFKGQWLSFDALAELCDHEVPFKHTLDQRYELKYDIARAAEAWGVLWTPKDTLQEEYTVYNPPSTGIHNIHFHKDENLPVFGRSVVCGPWPGDTTGQLGALSGHLNGVDVFDLRLEIVLQESPYAATLHHPVYFLYCSVIYPLACLGLSAMAGQALVSHRRRAKAAQKNSKSVPVDLQQFVLGMECASQFTNGVWALYSGLFGRDQIQQLNAFLSNQLLGVGMATTFLTAFYWHDLKETCLSMSKTQHKSVWARHGVSLALGAGLIAAIDPLRGVAGLYNLPGFVPISTLVSLLFQICVAIYFLREVRRSMGAFVSALSASAAKSEGSVRAMQRFHLAAKWLFRSAVCMLVNCAVLLILAPRIFEPKTGWPMYVFFYSASRWGTSFTQVMAIRPAKKKKKKKSSVAPPGTDVGSSMAASSVVSSQGLSSTGSSMKSTGMTSGRSSNNSNVQSSSRASSTNPTSTTSGSSNKSSSSSGSKQ